jgi:hypothetical protein
MITPSTGGRGIGGGGRIKSEFLAKKRSIIEQLPVPHSNNLTIPLLLIECNVLNYNYLQQLEFP